MTAHTVYVVSVRDGNVAATPQQHRATTRRGTLRLIARPAHRGTTPVLWMSRASLVALGMEDEEWIRVYVKDLGRIFVASRGRPNGYGASDIGGRFRVKGHPEIAHISYNGRLWTRDGTEYGGQ